MMAAVSRPRTPPTVLSTPAVSMSTMNMEGSHRTAPSSSTDVDRQDPAASPAVDPDDVSDIGFRDLFQWMTTTEKWAYAAGTFNAVAFV